MLPTSNGVHFSPCGRSLCKLHELLGQSELDDLSDVVEQIISTSNPAVTERIAALPHGSSTYHMKIDGLETPVELVGTLWTGAVSGPIGRGRPASRRKKINEPLNYTTAITSYALVCNIA